MSAYRYDGSINSAGLGTGIAGVQVFVLTQPADTDVFPPTPQATLYTDATGDTVATNPVVTDGFGNFFFYTNPGTYTLFYYDPEGRIPNEIFPDQAVTTQGGGTVTSVGLTMPAEFTVSGTPVTVSGVLAVAKANQNANQVYAGPASGSAAAPTFRALVSSDLPGGIGTVSSVGLTETSSPLLDITITGSPVTSSGAINIDVEFENLPANTVIAGPTSGGSSAPTARALAPADIAGATAVSFSATPVFNAATFALPTFTMTLTGNVTSSTLSNGVAGALATFVLKQDATGGRTFAWPTNVLGASAIGPEANSVSVQSFVFDGTNWRATGPGSWNPS